MSATDSQRAAGTWVDTADDIARLRQRLIGLHRHAQLMAAHAPISGGGHARDRMHRANRQVLIAMAGMLLDWERAHRIQATRITGGERS